MTNDYKDRARSALLFEYLQHSTAEDIPATRDQLCSFLSCDRKTLAREVSALRKCGFDIRVKKAGKQNAYYYGKNEISLAEMQIWLDEAHAGSYLPRETEEKLSDSLEELGGSRKAELLQESTILFNTRKHSDAPVLRTIEVLQQAIIDQKQATFLYFDWDANHARVYRREGARYTVQPVGLVNKDDNYYLLTWNEERESIAPYRLDRIDAAILAEEPVSEAAVAARQQVAEFTRQAFRMYGGETQLVTLQFDRTAINYIFDKFGREVSIRQVGKELFEAEVEVQVSPPFWGWIFQFSDIMQITAPDNVLEEYEARISAVRKNCRRLINRHARLRAAGAAQETEAAELEQEAPADESEPEQGPAAEESIPEPEAGPEQPESAAAGAGL